MFEVRFEDDGLAHTLDAEYVCLDAVASARAICTRTHDSGWTISGEVKEDWYTWVNDFEAHHPVFGRVWGNFESAVFADSEQGYDAFCAAHPPQTWDYGDI